MTTTSRRILIEDLHIAFGNTDVLKGVHLEIGPGEFFAFLGPSGSGKSTLLRAIAGFGPTPRGRIRIGETDVTRLPPWERNVGMVFQNYALWPHMTVFRNVAFGLQERKVPRAEIAPRVEQALKTVDLWHLADRRPAQLSGGQQQRVALARTIVVEPQVLLLDEPLSNLDANLRVQMRRELKALQRRLGITTIFVTHDQEEANTIADRMAVLDAGIIQQVGTPQQLYDEPANLFVAGFLGSANRLKGEIVTENDKRIFKSEAGISLPVAPNIAAGEAYAVFRPQNVRLENATHDNAQGKLSQTDAIAFPATITHSEFLGPLIRYGMRLGKEEILADIPHQAGDQIWPEGTSVIAHLRPEHIRFLRQ